MGSEMCIRDRWIPFAEAAAFVDSTLDALADLADRINELRKLGTEARTAEDRIRSERAIEFQARLTELEVWASAFEFGSTRPLDSERPIVVESESNALRAVRFELPRWNRAAFGFASDPLVNQVQAEQTPVSYTHLRAHETSLHLVCRLLLEKKN